MLNIDWDTYEKDYKNGGNEYAFMGMGREEYLNYLRAHMKKQRGRKRKEE